MAGALHLPSLLLLNFCIIILSLHNCIVYLDTWRINVQRQWIFFCIFVIIVISELMNEFYINSMW